MNVLSLNKESPTGSVILAVKQEINTFVATRVRTCANDTAKGIRTAQVRAQAKGMITRKACDLLWACYVSLLPIGNSTIGRPGQYVNLSGVRFEVVDKLETRPGVFLCIKLDEESKPEEVQHV